MAFTSRTQLATLMLVAVTALAAFGCRSPRRGVRVGSDTATLKVTMAGLAPSDSNRAEWIYELSGCIAALTGNLTGPATAEFTAIGLKKGMTGCQLRVRSVETSLQGLKFEGDPGVYYWVKDMTISQEADGTLSSIANLQRLYGVSGTSAALFTLNVPVKFAAAESGKVVTGAIQCSPEILTVGAYEKASDTEGTFAFKSEIPAEASYQCTAFEVRVDGAPDARHKGTFAGTSGDFTAKPGESVKTDVLALTVVEKPAGSGVDVTTTGEACNEDGMKYDAETRKCTCTDPKEVYDGAKQECVAKP